MKNTIHNAYIEQLWSCV